MIGGRTVARRCDPTWADRDFDPRGLAAIGPVLLAVGVAVLAAVLLFQIFPLDESGHGLTIAVHAAAEKH